MNASGGKVAASSVILLSEALVRLLATAAISFWIARQLGPLYFGVLNFASALTAILAGLVDMGMEIPVILRLSSAAEPGRLMGTVLAIRGGASVVVFLVAAMLAAASSESHPHALVPTLIVALCLPAAVPNGLDYWFKARTSAGAPAAARTLGTVLAAVAKGLCLVLGLGVIALAWTIVLETALMATGLWCAYWWSAARSAPARLSFDRSLVKPLIRESSPYLYSAVAVLAYMKIDLVMLGYLSTSIETGIYGLAQKLSEVLYIVPVALIASSFPSLLRRFQSGGHDAGRSEQMLFDLAVGGSLMAVVCGNLLAKPVILTVFGERYAPSVEIFHLHSWSAIAIAMNEARFRWMAALSIQRYAPIVTTLGLGINVAMNLVLIPRFGALGAAISTVVSYFISGYLSSFAIKPLNGLALAQTRALWPWHRLWNAARVWQLDRQPA